MTLNVITADQLAEKVFNKEKLFILDVRNESMERALRKSKNI